MITHSQPTGFHGGIWFNWIFNYLFWLDIITFFRIARYATVKTDESVLIIGGYTADGSPDRTTIIAEYRNDVWSNIGNFVQLRDTHGAVILGSTIMIVGGWPKSGSS